MYDPAATFWADLSAPISGTRPSARGNHGFTSAGGELYVHGGFESSGKFLCGHVWGGGGLKNDVFARKQADLDFSVCCLSMTLKAEHAYRISVDCDTLIAQSGCARRRELGGPKSLRPSAQIGSGNMRLASLKGGVVASSCQRLK